MSQLCLLSVHRKSLSIKKTKLLLCNLELVTCFPERDELKTRHMNSTFTFPVLTETIQSDDINQAIAILRQITSHANSILLQEDTDPLRVDVILQRAINEGAQVLSVLQASPPPYKLPDEWLVSCARCLGALVVSLREKLVSCRHRSVSLESICRTSSYLCL